MQFRIRASRLTLALALALPIAAVAQTVPDRPAPQTAPTPAPTGTPWLFQGSDIPADPAWRMGVLANGVRYAVRRNGVPPGQVSIRVRVDAGSLMERPEEAGYAHLLEHLAFRGSRHVADGDSRMVWQRLGVTFGSDSNATTSPTSTVYKLDLPQATDTGLDESVKIIAGMIAEPSITTEALAAERPVVLSEQREIPGPQMRYGEALRALFFAGQPLAERSPIGNIETLEKSTAASVSAFHSRWYRPERTVVVIAGDKDPAVLEAMIQRHFASWKVAGTATPTPDFGKPSADGPTTGATAEATLPNIVSFAYLRPWSITADTIQFNRDRMVDLVAVNILNRRLEERARSGAAYLRGGAGLEDVSRSVNGTFFTILPVGDDWEAALREVRAAVEEMRTTRPTQDEIDREVAEVDSRLSQQVATARVEAGAKQADDFVNAVDIAEVTASAETGYDIFQGAVKGGMFTPAAIQASAQRVFAGTATRALVNTRTPDTTASAKLATALNADVAASTAARATAAVSFDRLPRLGAAGTVAARAAAFTDPGVEIEQLTLSNGVRVQLFPNTSETGKVYVRVRFGRGLGALPAGRPNFAWTGSPALMASGIGELGQSEIDRMIGPRVMGASFAATDDAYIFAGTTSAADLTDQLRLFAAKLDHPRWDAGPVQRARAEMLLSFDSFAASPDGVIGRDVERLMRAGDPRWGTPERAEVEKLTPQAFRAFWEPILREGPVEVQIFGDATTEQMVAAVTATMGAMAPRKAATTTIAAPRFPAHRDAPETRRHNGQPNQAAAVIAWPTGGGSAGIEEGRKLEILAAVFSDRLFEQLRQQAGVSYAPNVFSQWPVGLPAGGRVVALGSVPPERVDFFFELARKIAADLAANPISDDELQRAITPVVQYNLRLSSGNTFWLQLAGGGSTDPQRLAALRQLVGHYRSTTPADLQALAAKYLRGDTDWTFAVLPETAGK